MPGSVSKGGIIRHRTSGPEHLKIFAQISYTRQHSLWLENSAMRIGRATTCSGRPATVRGRILTLGGVASDV